MLTFPSLKFKISADRNSGHVEKLQFQAPGAGQFDGDAYRCIGSALACLLWFGITDLHGSNVVFGLDPAGCLVFSPVDIECLFEDIYLPSQAHLVPAGKSQIKSSGLAAVRKYLLEHGTISMIAAVCDGFLEAISFFERFDAELMPVVSRDERLEVPVRVIIRSTRDYHAVLMKKGEPAAPPLAPSERVQLDRGDIPYFFRRMSRREILSYADDYREEAADLPQSQVDTAIALSRIPDNGIFPRRRNAAELRSLAPLQLARYFDPGIKCVKSSFGSVCVEYKDADIVLREGSGIALSCKRVAAAGEPAL